MTTAQLWMHDPSEMDTEAAQLSLALIYTMLKNLQLSNSQIQAYNQQIEKLIERLQEIEGGRAEQIISEIKSEVGVQ